MPQRKAQVRDAGLEVVPETLHHRREIALVHGDEVLPQHGITSASGGALILSSCPIAGSSSRLMAASCRHGRMTEPRETGEPSFRNDRRHEGAKHSSLNPLGPSAEAVATLKSEGVV
jgi:hypothetical protein